MLPILYFFKQRLKLVEQQKNKYLILHILYIVIVFN